MNGVKEAFEANFCRQNWHQLKILNIIILFPQILRSLVSSFYEFYFPDIFRTLESTSATKRQYWIENFETTIRKTDNYRMIIRTT
jgi:hypothetical protein